MEIDGIRDLMDHFLAYFPGPVTFPEEIASPYSSIPSDLLNYFYKNIRFVVHTKLMMTQNRWKTFLALKFGDMFSSHEMYLRYTMAACSYVAHITANIYDRVLSVFALIMYFHAETRKTMGVDFLHLTLDVFMVFYDNALQEPFNRNGGIERLVEYVCGHECLVWNWNWNENPPIDYQIFLAHVRKDDNLKKIPYRPELISHDHVLSHQLSLVLARKVLSSTGIQLPPLPSSDELKVKLRVLKKEKAALLEKGKKRLDALGVKLHKTNKSREQKMTASECDKIVLSVIACNNSRNVASKNCVPKEVTEFLDYLNRTIRSLIDVLDEDE